MQFYMSAVGIALTIVAALVAGLLGWRLSRGRVVRSAHRWSIAVLAMSATVVLMTWDVVRTSLMMAELCPQAGLFVMKSVRVDGFYTDFGSPDMLKRGFKYIESRSYANRIIFYSRDNEVVHQQEFDAKQYRVQSQYEYVYGADTGAYQGRQDIGIHKSVVRDRLNNEKLGYALRFIAYPGWVDQRTVGLISRFFWGCKTETPDQNLLLSRKVLLPITEATK